MTYEAFTCYFLLGAIAFFQIGRIYERRSNRRYSRAAEGIRQKYQSHISSPARTTKN